MSDYHLQFCGDEWLSADGEQAGEIRLWDDDYPVAVVEYKGIPGYPHSRGTYTITQHDMPAGSYSESDLHGWRDWRDAIEFASGTKRGEWS